MASGDIISQYLTQETPTELDAKFNWDMRRTLHFGIIGMGLGAYLHSWYGFLCNRLVPGKETLGIAAKRVVVDQAFNAPFTLLCFFQAIGTMEGKNQSEINQMVKDKFIKTMMLNYVIWPPAMLINFRYVPESYRVAMVNVVGLCWNVLLSSIKHQENE